MYYETHYFAASIRRMAEGNVFNLFVSPRGRRVPWAWSRVPGPFPVSGLRSFSRRKGRGVPSQVPGQGTPHPCPLPSPSQDQDGRGTSVRSQVRVPPPPNQDQDGGEGGGVRVPLSGSRSGYSPHPPTVHATQDILRVVRLLRSSRRTFLLHKDSDQVHMRA